MTIAITAKVHDGLVLATDSATTLSGPIGPNGEQAVANVYNNANKIFNLYKGLPVGGMTWGLGNIGTASISTIAKDLRWRLTSGDTTWKIDSENYTIQDIAQKARRLFFEELYAPTFQNLEKKPDFGFLVAGYSSDQGLAEEWLIQTIDGTCEEPQLLRTSDNTGMSWYGQPEAVTRLILGYGLGLQNVLAELGVPAANLPAVMQIIKARLQVQILPAAMPIQDTIDLAEFLVHTASMFSRFLPGAQVVGGPIESVAITKHEGFKWVKRKHYYDPQLNPEKRERA